MSVAPRRTGRAQPVGIDVSFLWKQLMELLETPSPSGYTDTIVHHVVDVLEGLGFACELTRRGAIRAVVEGESDAPLRSIVTHLDTIGAMVRQLKDNGRVALAPVGHWSARFAEGGRVSVLTEGGPVRGTVLPLKASGHVFGDEIDEQPVGWDHVELRVDEPCHGSEDLERLGISIGDFVSFDPTPEITDSGYVNSRHLDDKAGVAALLAAVKGLRDAGRRPATTSYLLFTIAEEVGSGASGVLHGDVAEMVAIDNATPAPGQASIERGVTIAAMDSSGPFDYHLTRRLVGLCRDFELPHAIDVFRNYRCDAASAVDSGCDVRTALACFGADGSHGYERTHIHSLTTLAQLLALYLQSPAVAGRDRRPLAPVEGFTDQPMSPPPTHPVVPSVLPTEEENVAGDGRSSG